MAEQSRDPGEPESPGGQASASPAEIASGLLPRNIGAKVGALLAVSIVIALGFIAYVLDSRGVFEQTQRMYLITDNAEGINVGTDLTFSGFPIGRVRRITLRDDGKVRISVRVPVSDAKWLRESSVFVIDVPLVGAAKLRAFTANLQDAPLADRAERPVLRGDTTEEIPRMVASMRAVLENLDQITESGSSLQESLKSTRTVAERMAGKYGVLGGLMGGEDNASKVVASIDRANALLTSLGGVSQKLDSVLFKTDQRVFGQGGVVDETQKAVTQANAILGDVRESLKKVDALLVDAQAVGANAKAATTDLVALRAEVELSLRKVNSLIEEINRKWPFGRETQIKLP